MIRLKIKRDTGLSINNSVEGESIENKIERLIENNEPISDSAPIIYTERKDGVLPQYDIRTDRFELAIDAMDKVSRSHVAKRVEMYKKDDSLEQSSDNTSDTTGTSKE
ncbi:MAG: hypothetical protein GX957_09185 [Clostridiaceae bacterium]|nr:hypothetical protein [Clostridiaceae bacterium]